MITFTEKGAEKVQEFLASQSADVQTSGLRVGVRGGGCSGFQYALAFDTQRDGDTVFEDHGLRILVDNPSLPYVKGAVVDYVEQHAGRRLQGRQPERHRGLRLRLLLPRGGGGRGLRGLRARWRVAPRRMRSRLLGRRDAVRPRGAGRLRPLRRRRGDGRRAAARADRDAVPGGSGRDADA